MQPSPGTLAERPISLHFLGQEAVLFDSRRQRLYAANPCAALILCHLDDGLSPGAVAALLAGRFGLTRARARRYVESVAPCLEAESEPGYASDRRVEAAAHWPAPAAPAAAPRLAAAAAERRYRLLDSSVAIRFASRALCDWVDPVFCHLAAAGSGPADVVFELAPAGGGFALTEGGACRGRCERLEQTAALVKCLLVEAALRRCRGFSAVHAGAARRDGEAPAVLIPGVSGSGKSTLVAGLGAAGFEVFGDDTVVLSDGALAVRPLPSGLCVKAGAWRLLGPLFPRLRLAPVHDRPDGKRVKYLLPPDYAIAPPEAAAAVGWIVFPTFDPGAPTELAPIAPSLALQRLMPSFLALRQRLSAAEVERLVRWIAAIPCYSLRAASLDAAVSLVARTCR